MANSTQLQSTFAHTKGEPVPDFHSETPAHPALVHFPIAFNTLAWALDILYGLTAIWLKPSFLTKHFGDDATLLDLSRLSYFLLCAGLLSTIPAVMSGGIQLMGMIKKNGGVWEKDAQVMNDVIFVIGLYSWYNRRSTVARPNVGNLPSSMNVMISAALLPMLMATAKAGGTLVYNHGVGLKLGRKKLE